MATLNFPDAPSTGDTYTDSNAGFTYEWNGTVWISQDPSTASNIREIDNISSGFDGSDTTFTLQVAGVDVEPANVQQLIISVGGVMQNAGDDYTVSGSTLTFTTAPTSGLTFFGTLLGTALSLNTVADGSVGTASFEQPLTIGTANDSLTIPGNAVVSGILTAGNAYVSGILTAKTLNYDNVTDIFSTGIITATAGIQQTGNEGLHVSSGITTVGIFTATKATIGIGVTLNNTGIDAGNAGIVTAGTVSAPSSMELQVGGTGVGIGTDDPAKKLEVWDETQGVIRIRGGGGGSDSSRKADLSLFASGAREYVVRVDAEDAAFKIVDVSGSNAERLCILNNGRVGIATDSPASTLQVSGKSSLFGDGAAAVEWGDTSALGALSWTATAGNPIVRANSNKDLVLQTNGANERLRITAAGGFSFNNGQLIERVKITAGKLSDNTSIDLVDGMVYYFTTTETTTLAPNIRIDGSNTLNDAMAVGDVISVTLVTTAAAAGYINQLNIDGSSQTVEWAGAEAPSAGGDGGLDINAFTIIKTAANTYKVLGNYTNFD